MVRDGAVAIAAFDRPFDRLRDRLRDHLKPVELAAMLLALKGGNHLVHQVVDVQQFQLN